MKRSSKRSSRRSPKRSFRGAKQAAEKVAAVNTDLSEYFTEYIIEGEWDEQSRGMTLSHQVRKPFLTDVIDRDTQNLNPSRRLGEWVERIGIMHTFRNGGNEFSVTPYPSYILFNDNQYHHLIGAKIVPQQLEEAIQTHLQTP